MLEFYYTIDHRYNIMAGESVTPPKGVDLPQKGESVALLLLQCLYPREQHGPGFPGSSAKPPAAFGSPVQDFSIGRFFLIVPQNRVAARARWGIGNLTSI